MFQHSNSVTPAVQTHLDAQAAMFNDLSRSMTNSIQNIFQANFQLGQSLLEEAVAAGARLLTASDTNSAFSDVAAHAQPAADKMRAYQRHLSRIAANTQVELAQVVERHVPETTRTAHVLADQVNRAAADETERSVHQQEQALKNFRDPFQQAEARSR